MMELDFNDHKFGTTAFSQEDKLFLLNERELPNNRQMAIKELRPLQGNLARDENYRKDCLELMDYLISEGHAEEVELDQVSLKDVFM